jgi:hypothetical protein
VQRAALAVSVHDEASTLPGGMKAAVESYKQASDMISK